MNKAFSKHALRENACYALRRMSQRIMPPGYSLEFKRKELEAQLRQARAAEIAQATDAERMRIKKEIKAEVNRQIIKLRLNSSCGGGGSVLWML
jgi:hypothetical protein